MDKPQSKQEQEEFEKVALDFSIDKGENLFTNQRNYALRVYSLAFKHAKERPTK